MTTEQTTNGRPGSSRRFFRFLGRFLWALVRVVLVLTVIAALAFGGYLGIRELAEVYLDLSADSVETSARVDLLRADVNSLMANETDGRRLDNDFQNNLTALDGRISAVEQGMAADLARQEEQLDALEGQLAAVVEAGATISENVSVLSAGISTLQTDIVGLDGDIDNLGGEVDGLQSEVVSLDSQAAALEETLADPLAATADVEELRQILLLFRVWELVARARLRLIDGNLGLALTDVQAAQAALAAVIESSSEEMTARLEPVQLRLILAANSLPDDGVTAARDLESGWEALDSLLGELLALPEASAEEGSGSTEGQGADGG